MAYRSDSVELPRLRLARILRDMSQPQLAKAASSSTATINKVESGGRIRPAVAQKIALALCVRLDGLMEPITEDDIESVFTTRLRATNSRRA